jgi:O-antigen/teichoic acid export membrane protein
VVTPVLARVRTRESEAAMKDAYASLVRLIGLVVIPAAVGLCLLTPRLLLALYPKFAEAWPFAVVFVAFVFLDMILGVAQTALMTLERYRPVLLLRLTAFLSLPVMALLLPRYGLLGVAWGFGLVRILPPLLVTLYAGVLWGLPFPLRFLGRVAFASACFAVPLRALLEPAPRVMAPSAPNVAAVLPLLGYAALGAALFLGALKATGGLDSHDRRRLLELRLPFKDRLARLL